jgi:DNA polymerase-1
MLDFFKEGKDIHKMTASQIFNIPEEKVGNKERSIAKTINFGVLYGMGIVGLAEASGIQRSEAKKFIEEYFNDFKGIASYVENSIKEAKDFGFSKTFFGRKRFLPEIHSTDFRIRQAAERMAINHPVQGTSADIIKMAMVEISKKIPISGKNSRLLLQVHDELVFEIKKELILEESKKIKKIMEGVVAFEVPLTVEVQEGKSWGELKDIVL